MYTACNTYRNKFKGFRLVVTDWLTFSIKDYIVPKLPYIDSHFSWPRPTKAYVLLTGRFELYTWIVQLLELIFHCTNTSSRRPKRVLWTLHQRTRHHLVTAFHFHCCDGVWGWWGWRSTKYVMDSTHGCYCKVQSLMNADAIVASLMTRILIFNNLWFFIYIPRQKNFKESNFLLFPLYM